LGVDGDSINATIRGVPAIVSGVPTSPYGAVITTIITNPPIVDGYSYLLTKSNRYGFNEDVVIEASATDLHNNTATVTSTFTTFNDEIGPSINGMSPRNGQLEVPLDSLIEFNARDGYDVALEKSQVIVDARSAISSGLPQSGYLLSTSRISGGVLGVEPGDGYGIQITNREGWEYNSIVSVTVKAYDKSQSNLTTETYVWTTVSPSPPIFDAEITSNKRAVPLDTDFVFDILSDGYGVDIDSLYFRISNTVII